MFRMSGVGVRIAATVIIIIMVITSMKNRRFRQVQRAVISLVKGRKNT
jgi:hypothetical protein